VRVLQRECSSLPKRLMYFRLHIEAVTQVVPIDLAEHC
jgi:hypothetical protein